MQENKIDETQDAVGLLELGDVTSATKGNLFGSLVEMAILPLRQF